MFLCIFPTYFFPRYPKIIPIFSRKNYFKSHSTLKLFFFLFNTDETQLFNFSYVLHVNRVFHACIHDTRLIANYYVDRFRLFLFGKIRREWIMSKVRLGMIDSYLCEFVWRKRNEKGHNFGQIFLDIRGPTPFEDMIFYLWTDSNEICTRYVKLKINHILFMKFFRFSI